MAGLAPVPTKDSDLGACRKRSQRAGRLWTPAMQAGMTTRRLTLREIFPPAILLSLSEKVKFPQSTVLLVADGTRMPLAA